MADPDTDKKLRAAVRSIVDIFREFEQAARAGAMSVPQYRILLFLRNGPCRAGELAAQAAVKKPSITPIITTLEERGWIRREANPADRRSVHLTLTDEGAEAMMAFEDSLVTVIESLLGPEFRDAFLASFAGVSQRLLQTREVRFRRLREELLGPDD